VSKTPVREAFALLHGDGLVQLVPYRGAMVRWLSVAELREQHFLLEALELPALPIIVQRATPQQLEEIDGFVQAAARASHDRDDARLGDLATQIRVAMLACTGFRRASTLMGISLGPVGTRYDRLLVYPFADARSVMLALLTDRHEALLRGDAQRAVGVVRAHRAELQRLALACVRLPDVARFFQDD
jgi:DNA-binding GntR family transcriptional regulator